MRAASNGCRRANFSLHPEGCGYKEGSETSGSPQGFPDLSSGIRPLKQLLDQSYCLPIPSSFFPVACNGFAGVAAMFERVLISTRRARAGRAAYSAFFLSPPAPGTAGPSVCARRSAGLPASARCCGDGALVRAPYSVRLCPKPPFSAGCRRPPSPSVHRGTSESNSVPNAD